MIDENTNVLMGQLRNIQGTLNICAYCLIVLTIMAAAAAWRVFGGPL
jgi:hypothetical protein